MPWQLQRRFDFTAAERQAEESSPQIKEGGAEEPPCGDSVQDLAEELRPRLLAYLADASGPVELRDLQSVLGHPGQYMDQDPQRNPVNRLVKEMRDAGELVVREFDRGQPLVSLPEEDAPQTAAAELGSWEHDVAERFEQNFVLPVMQELGERPWSTSEAIGNRALGRKQIENRIRTAADILRKQMAAGSVQIAWDKSGMPHYAPPGLAVPDGFITQADIDANGGEFPTEPSAHKGTPSLVRPDRQVVYDGATHYDWPSAKELEDRDTITVDRITDDIDGPAHRFVVRRGDTVEAFFSRDKQEIGEVVGISHANRQVRVRFGDTGQGIWFAVGQIYPAIEGTEQSNGTSLSTLVEQASQAPPGGFTEADRVATTGAGELASAVPLRESRDSLAEQRPFLLTDYRTFLQKLEAGEIELAELKSEFTRLTESHAAFVTELTKSRSADQLKRLAVRFGCFDANRNTKHKNAEHIYGVVLQGFTLSESVTFQPMKETRDEAVARIVDGLTEEDLARHIAEQRQEKQDREQAESDPQTIDQFRLYLRQHSYRDLTSEQQDRFDRLMADQSRQQRREQRSRSTVSQIESEGAEGLEFKMIEGFHSKQQIPLWICQLSTRVDSDTFKELKHKAKMLDGCYSSFVREQAGFQFKTKEAAEKFQTLLAGDVDRREILEGRRSRKMDTASERLTAVAESLEQNADLVLDADAFKLKNTVRRAEMAAGMRGQAYADKAMAGTLQRIAGSLADDQVQYLDGLRAKTHVETLIGLLRRAKNARNTELMKEHEQQGMWERHAAREELDNRPTAFDDVAFVEYPYPRIYKRHLEEAVAVAQKTHGLKQRARRMESHLVCTDEYVSFVDEADVAFLQEFVDRSKGWTDTRWIESGMEDYKRLRAANIHTPHELRSALRELLPQLTAKQDDDPVTKLEEQLIGTKIPGFFPTPRPVISRMLELIEIEPGDCVLEPSAGKGDILDMLREQHPDTIRTALEMQSSLVDIIEAKGHDVEQRNFLQYEGKHDVIVMNPPFESGNDIRHVRHAYEQLAPGGRLVAVMSAGPFFRSDQKAVEFREWLEELDHDVEDLPDDAFKGVEAFRETGVRTKLLLLSKPDS